MIECTYYKFITKTCKIIGQLSSSHREASTNSNSRKLTIPAHYLGRFLGKKFIRTIKRIDCRGKDKRMTNAELKSGIRYLSFCKFHHPV